MKDIKWAVLGTGVIANEMAVALKKNGRNIYAVGNRTYDKAVAFAEKYGIGKVYSDYNEMFTDPEVDVIYITTPHNTHIQFMRRAIENGKHILVEKSITLNSGELGDMLELAEQHNVIIGEAMTIYHMPIYRKLKELLDSGALGKVNLITMNFGSFKDYDMNNRFFNRNLAGGAMLDIGAYALSFIRWFMDSKPDKLLSQVKPAPTGVDEQAGLLLMNKEGQMATVMLSLHSKQPKRGMVSCENGYIEVMEYPRAWEAKVTYTDTGKTETVAAGENADALAYELQDMESAISGDGDMYLEYTKDVMDMMNNMIGPIGMLLAGMVIADVPLKTVFTKKRNYVSAVLRLVIYPIFILILMKVIYTFAGLNDSKQILLTVYIASITPACATVTSMAQLYDKDAAYASSLYVLTTLLSIVTMPVMVGMYEMFV